MSLKPLLMTVSYPWSCLNTWRIMSCFWPKLPAPWSLRVSFSSISSATKRLRMILRMVGWVPTSLLGERCLVQIYCSISRKTSRSRSNGGLAENITQEPVRSDPIHRTDRPKLQLLILGYRTGWLTWMQTRI